MDSHDFETFKAKALAAGADDVLERHWAAHQVVETHSHPFDADVLVTAGEVWLILEEGTRHLRPGDTFRLASGTPHGEHYGPEGATYWVAQRHPPIAVG